MICRINRFPALIHREFPVNFLVFGTILRCDDLEDNKVATPSTWNTASSSSICQRGLTAL